MKPIANFDQVPESTDFKRLVPGGYIVRFEAVDELADKEYFQIVYDVAEGEFKGLYSDEWGKEHAYAHTHRASYKEKAHGLFKSMLSSIDKSNNCKLVDKAQKAGITSADLKGKLVGAVIGYETYVGNDGNDKQRLVIRSFKSVDDIRSGNFQVPQPKAARGSTQTADADPSKDFIPADNIPF